MTVVVVGPALLAVTFDQVARPLAIPGDLWLFAVIYAEWVHHRLRPWCPYCGPWDDEGDEEPSPCRARTATRLGPRFRSVDDVVNAWRDGVAMLDE